MTDSDWQKLCATAEVTEDQPAAAMVGTEEVAVFRIGERFCVTQNLCTHGPGKLSEGYVDGEEVECPFHQGRFNILTGQPTAPPCTEALRTWDAKVDGADVWVRKRSWDP